MKTRIISLSLITLAFLVNACTGDIPLYEENKSTEGGWFYKDSVDFNVYIDDTLHKYNIYLNLRNTRDYLYNNFFMYVQMISPDGKMRMDTAEVFLANEYTGKWNGSGSSGIYSNSFLFRHDEYFPVVGEYQFSIQQAMRYEPVNEILDVGIKIERARKE